MSATTASSQASSRGGNRGGGPTSSSSSAGGGAEDGLAAVRLPQLQNLIKRDPEAYKAEFELQLRHFNSEMEIFRLRPTLNSDRFTDLISFVSHVASCYRERCADVPTRLLELLETEAHHLHPDVRAKLLDALMLLRNRGLLDPLVLIKLAFKLMAIQDKSMRSHLRDYIIQDIKLINHDKNNEKLNRRVQAHLFTLINEDSSVVPRKIVEILAELYRRRIWTDARTVNVIGSACTNQSIRVAVAGMNFFLGIETQMEEEEEEEKAALETTNVNYHEHSKKTKKRARQVKRQLDRNSKVQREKETEEQDAVPLFPAIQLLHDPQSIAEQVFAKLKHTGVRFEVKLLMINFVSRLIGCHELILLNFYR